MISIRFWVRSEAHEKFEACWSQDSQHNCVVVWSSWIFLESKSGPASHFPVLFRGSWEAKVAIASRTWLMVVMFGTIYLVSKRFAYWEMVHFRPRCHQSPPSTAVKLALGINVLCFSSRNECRALSRAISNQSMQKYCAIGSCIQHSPWFRLGDFSAPSIKLATFEDLCAHRIWGMPHCQKLQADLRTCPNLQYLELLYQRNITVTGVRRLISCCPHLRSIGTSAKL